MFSFIAPDTSSASAFALSYSDVVDSPSAAPVDVDLASSPDTPSVDCLTIFLSFSSGVSPFTVSGLVEYLNSFLTFFVAALFADLKYDPF